MQLSCAIGFLMFCGFSRIFLLYVFLYLVLECTLSKAAGSKVARISLDEAGQACYLDIMIIICLCFQINELV